MPSRTARVGLAAPRYHWYGFMPAPTGLLGEDGGEDGNRTRGLLCATQALSQLSYNPMDLVELRGFEPRTSCMPSTRSPN